MIECNYCYNQCNPCNTCNSCNPCYSHCYSYCHGEIDKEITYICNYDYNYFLNKPHVVGVALGYKYINGYETDEKCIDVLVDEQFYNGVSLSNPVIPPVYHGIPTDIVQVGTLDYTRSLRDRIRPAIGGCSIGNPALDTNGTLGCLVKDSNGLYILSNNHVLAGINVAPIGSPIIQPGLVDGGTTPNDIIATLDRFIPITFITPTTSPANEVDCAIAKVTMPSIVTPEIAIIGRPPQGTVVATLGARAKKVGRSTALTTGAVRAINATIKIRNSLYKNLFFTTVTVDKGDSGALVLDVSDNAMGLVVSRDGASNAICCSMEKILELLQVSLVTS